MPQGRKDNAFRPEVELGAGCNGVFVQLGYCCFRSGGSVSSVSSFTLDSGLTIVALGSSSLFAETGWGLKI